MIRYVDGVPVRLCGPEVTDPAALEAIDEVVRAGIEVVRAQPPRCRARPPADSGRHLPCLRTPHEKESAHRDGRGREWT